MTSQSQIVRQLPCPMPTEPLLRDTLIVFRRLAIHGRNDAQASHFAMHRFGRRFRQILVLIRCFLHETASESQRRIQIASCCAPRMTRDEALLIDAIRGTDHEALSAVTDNDAPDRALCSAAHLRETLRDISPDFGA